MYGKIVLIYLFGLVMANRVDKNSTEWFSEYGNKQICCVDFCEPKTVGNACHIPSKKRCSKRARDCMHDKQCWLFGDCCEHMKFVPSFREKITRKFSCERTAFDGDVSMIATCPNSWTDEVYRDMCEMRDRVRINKNMFLKTPATSFDTEFTYKNIFCAVCNSENNFQFWDLALIYEGRYLPRATKPISVLRNESAGRTAFGENKYDTSTSVEKNLTTVVRIEEILVALAFNVTGESIWTFDIDGKLHACNIEAKVPLQLETAETETTIRHCIPNVISTCKNNGHENSSSCANFADYVYAGNSTYKNVGCALCNNAVEYERCSPSAGNEMSRHGEGNDIFRINFTHPDLPKPNYCAQFPNKISVYESLCGTPAQSNPTRTKYLSYCYLTTRDGKSCQINSMYGEGTEFHFNANRSSAFVYQFQSWFDESEWEWRNDTKEIYLCGIQVPRSASQRFYDSLDLVVTEVSLKVSLFSLAAFIITFVYCKNLTSLPNKILTSLCVALFCVYSLHEITPLLADCIISSAVTHYLYLSCFCWSVIASYDFWLVICRISLKFQTLTGKGRMKRFLIYSAVGWISPMAVMSVAIFFELSPVGIIPCDLKPGYGQLNKCFLSQPKPIYYFFIYPLLVAFTINCVFFLHTTYTVRLSRKRGVRSTVRNNYYSLFTKLAVIMGLTWSVGAIYTITNYAPIGVLHSLINTSQGTFIYFAFAFRRQALADLLEKHKDHKIIRHTRGTFLTVASIMRKNHSMQTSTENETQANEVD